MFNTQVFDVTMRSLSGGVGGDEPLLWNAKHEIRTMPTYVTLWNFTQHGIENIEDSPDRLDNAIELLESMGGELKGFYLTMGQYDLVTVAEFPDDDTAAQVTLRIGKGGAVSSETLKAWPEDDYRDLIANLP